jgi:UDP-3-O-[3-hydroxymyristoyl] N-acetylglucosamine deacetylase/3-hydroxyacyl-[acyl-carrier-protein] dehydratase
MNENFFTFLEASNVVVSNCRSNGTNRRDIVLSTVPDPENYLTYFMKIDNVKFNKSVTGDTLIFKCDLITPIRRGFVI